jgi:hypothetical protein
VLAHFKMMAVTALIMAPTIVVDYTGADYISCAAARGLWAGLTACVDWQRAYWFVTPPLVLSGHAASLTPY